MKMQAKDQMRTSLVGFQFLIFIVLALFMLPSLSHASAMTIGPALASLVNAVFNLLKEAFNVLLWECISFLLRVNQDPLSALVILAVLV